MQDTKMLEMTTEELAKTIINLKTATMTSINGHYSMEADKLSKTLNKAKGIWVQRGNSLFDPRITVSK